jgi:CDP-glucose 4,6-dehydratase
MKNIQNFFKNKKVLITGHTGFKGAWLTKILFNWGTDIVGIALRPATTPNLFSLLNIKSNLTNYFTDIRNFKKVKEIFIKEKPEIVFHLAAQSLVRDSYDDPLYTFETNIIGTVNILQVMKEVGGIKSAIIITTDKVYENKRTNSSYKEDDKLGGYDPYSSSKAGAEIVINSYIKSFFNPKDYGKKHKTLIASARCGNAIGGGDWAKDRIVTDIVRSVFEKNEKIIIRNPNSIRPWQYVLEPLYGYLLLAKRLYEGESNLSGPWNFGPSEGNYLKVEELVEEAIKILKKGSYTIKRDFGKPEAEVLRLNIDKAKNILGWQPKFNLRDALEFAFDWYRDFYNKKDIVNSTNKQIKLFFNEV